MGILGRPISASFYGGDGQNQEDFTVTDKLILRLLYDLRIKSGMGEALALRQAEQIIRSAQ